MEEGAVCKRPAREWAKAIRDRQVGVEELAQLFLRRIQRYDGAQGLNAIRQVNPDILPEAREMDRHAPGEGQPLYGLPILIKDNIDVRGLCTTAGSPALAGRSALQDAPVVAALRRQGALILGKTNMTEFANYTTGGMPNGYSALGGQVRSAYGEGRDPSGSSSGSAVAVSAGLCAAAVGTDTSFSVVACAAQNGLAGLKPPVGALSGEGILPIAHTLDSPGALAHDFEDALLLYAGMGGRLPEGLSPLPPEQLRIAVNDSNLQMVGAGQLQMVAALCERMKEAGASFTRLSQPPVSYQREIMRYEFRHDLEVYLARSAKGPKTLQEIVAFYEADPGRMPYGIDYLRQALFGPSGRLDDAAYLQALSQRAQLQAQLSEQLGGVHACILTGPSNVMHTAGLPSLALPLGMGDDGTPRGVILYGINERQLYAAALTIARFCQRIDPPALREGMIKGQQENKK